MPTWPWLLYPQHMMLLPVTIAQVWECPAVTAVAETPAAVAFV
jgi:hypothetical protein